MHDHIASENIELQGMLAWYEAASRLNLSDFDWSFEQVGDAYCSISSSDPSILINRVMGLGARSTPSMDQLLRIGRLYEAAGVSRFFLHLVPELVTPKLEKMLIESGYRKHRGWMKFTRGPGENSALNTDLTIREIGPTEAPEFARIAAAAFDLLPTSERVVAALTDAPKWRLFMSFDGERAAGTGALFIDN